MWETFRKITHTTLNSVGIDPLRAGLARFIPEAGVLPVEFIRLPIEPALGDISASLSLESGKAVACYILLQSGILPDLILHNFALFMAREVLPIFENEFPDEDRLRNGLDAKKRWLNGNFSDSRLLAAAHQAHNVVSINSIDYCSEGAQKAARAVSQACDCFDYEIMKSRLPRTYLDVSSVFWNAAGAKRAVALLDARQAEEQDRKVFKKNLDSKLKETRSIAKTTWESNSKANKTPENLLDNALSRARAVAGHLKSPRAIARSRIRKEARKKAREAARTAPVKTARIIDAQMGQYYAKIYTHLSEQIEAEATDD